ncbi:BON domain-containing protein [Nonomuraea guangzhouensis]|uniref:BON domain-containing protein n=1 Tax=Nonomuraea guangzhouensis TaxID=1291555 RepID=A0ABW4GY20_9ACTN|nr:BON domain-containing protein [Nonomuraea guangzhouensis]
MVLPRLLRLDPLQFTVHVRAGVVTIFGQVARRSVVPTLVEMIRQVEGVLRVIERIAYDLDDRLSAPAIHWGGRA